jgi:hypothetical protein
MLCRPVALSGSAAFQSRRGGTTLRARRSNSCRPVERFPRDAWPLANGQEPGASRAAACVAASGASDAPQAAC